MGIWQGWSYDKSESEAVVWCCAGDRPGLTLGLRQGLCLVRGLYRVGEGLGESYAGSGFGSGHGATATPRLEAGLRIERGLGVGSGWG